jgi:hypothetical protein
MGKMKTIEDLLISQDEIDRIYTGELTLYLWRSLHKKARVKNPLYPDFDPREIRAGVLRAPDVEIKRIGEIEHVIARLGQGTSMFDQPNVFGTKHWAYFEIPEGTIIPQGLIITKDSYSHKYKATHYSLSPNYTMPKARFIFLLDQLAQNAISQKRKVQNGRG